jgi:hypothetical protein
MQQFELGWNLVGLAMRSGGTTAMRLRPRRPSRLREAGVTACGSRSSRIRCRSEIGRAKYCERARHSLEVVLIERSASREQRARRVQMGFGIRDGNGIVFVSHAWYPNSQVLGLACPPAVGVKGLCSRTASASPARAPRRTGIGKAATAYATKLISLEARIPGGGRTGPNSHRGQ